MQNETRGPLTFSGVLRGDSDGATVRCWTPSRRYGRQRSQLLPQSGMLQCQCYRYHTNLYNYPILINTIAFIYLFIPGIACLFTYCLFHVGKLA